jgi:hypothetical protein
MSWMEATSAKTWNGSVMAGEERGFGSLLCFGAP